jgi:hypothetical protein
MSESVQIQAAEETKIARLAHPNLKRIQAAMIPDSPQIFSSDDH